MADNYQKQPQTGTCRPRTNNNRAWWLAAALLILVIANTGCDPISTLGFLIAPFAPNTFEPPCVLTAPDKESKVVFLCANEQEVADLSFRGADEAVCQKLVAALTQCYKENKEKIKIVPVRDVYSYIRQHKDWATRSKLEIAKHFNADFLVYIELGPMSMIEPNSSGTLYRGIVDYRVTAIDVQQPEGDVKFNQSGTTTTREEARSDISAADFKDKFLNRIVKDLAKCFAPSPTQDRMNDD